MSEPNSGKGVAAPTHGETLALPDDSLISKLPLPRLSADGGHEVPQELKAAWTSYMINGFKQNEQMFKTTLRAFMKPYRMTVWLYGILFIVGLGLFIVAAIIGLRNGNSVVAVTFGGLGCATFLTFFVRQPMQALEENLEFITWLGVAFNTYWTRLMYMSDAREVQEQLRSAENDFRNSVEGLIAQHAERRAKRPNGPS